MQKNRHLQFIAEWFSNKPMSSAVTPDLLADKTEFINSLSTIYWAHHKNKEKDGMEEKYLCHNRGILLLVLAFYFIFIYD